MFTYNAAIVPIRVLCRYLGTSLEDNVVSIFMQFVPGGSIANVLARFGALEEEVFCNYTKQILEGVEYLHQNNVIHRWASFSLSLLNYDITFPRRSHWFCGRMPYCDL